MFTAITPDPYDEIDELGREIKRLKAALEFYADIRNHDFNIIMGPGSMDPDIKMTSIEYDRGKIAREALCKAKAFDEEPK